MKRLWAACLFIIGLNALILAAPNIVGQRASDIIVLVCGGIDLIVAPILVYASMKLYLKK